MFRLLFRCTRKTREALHLKKRIEREKKEGQ